MTSESNPKVSLVITCYNYGKYVAEAIESVLKQTYDNVDLLVIDDGSTDNSLEVIEKYRHYDQVEIISRKNKGIVYTRNEALRVTKGEFICFLDADDFFDQDYIEKMVSIAHENDADVVYPNWHVFGDDKYTKSFPEFDLQRLIRQEIHCTSESLIRRAAIGDHKFESEKVAEDWDFFLGLALDDKKFKLAEDCYINYRVRRDTRGSTRPYWDDMYHFYDILMKWSRKYPTKVNPLDLPVYAGRLRDAHIEAQDRIIHDKDVAIGDKEAAIEQQQGHIEVLEKQLARMFNSYAFKIGSTVIKPFSVLKRGVQKVKRYILSLKDSSIDEHYYKDELRMLSDGLNRDGKGKFAVVIHLYYVDNWPLFKHKLELLPDGAYDVFITIPEKNEYFGKEILQDFPDARIIKVPNRGRDVLPFIKVAQALQGLDYNTVLKFHSKKSTHRQDGQDWLESMLDQIIPEDPKALGRVLKAVGRQNFGVLGPADVYYPLTINFPANGKHMTKVMSEVFNRHTTELVLQQKRKEYGFFGGTMFWVNLDAIRPLLSYGVARFEAEAGQIDATFAHALERAFCVVPEVNGRDMYSSDGETVIKRPYESDNIPEWSEDHEK